MKYPRGLITLAALGAVAAFGQQATEPDLAKFSDPAVWRVHNRAASGGAGRQPALRLDAREGDGVAWLVGSDFAAGTIEVDLRGANKPGQSFVGIAFRGESDTTYDAAYFRAFNFKNPDLPRRSHAVQYISHPQFTWEKLRADHPGKYEAAVSPVPDPDDWFHARIVIEARKVSIYVNGSATSSLVVTELSPRTGGWLGLWVGNGSSGDFANLKITPKKPQALLPP